MKIIVQKRQFGLSLIEMMISLAIALFLMAVGLGVYLQETNLYKTTGTQASIQSSQNAISALVSPVIRSAGFMGCSSLSNWNGTMYKLVAGGAPPLGNITSTGEFSNNPPASVYGYDALYSNAATPITINENAANDATATHWSPSLDATLAGLTEQGSDVLVVVGPVPGSQPVSVVTVQAGGLVLPAGLATSTFNSFAPNAGTWVAMSDCSKAYILQVTLASPNLSYAAGSGAALTNVAGIGFPEMGTLPVNNIFWQVIPLQQTAFFVAQGSNGQSALWTAVLGPNNTLVNAAPLIPGVDNMQVLYGVSSLGGSGVQKYLRADQVTTANLWGAVHTIRIGFLLAGQPGSATSTTATATVLDATVNLSTSDTRLRHVFEIIINLRNAS